VEADGWLKMRAGIGEAGFLISKPQV